MDRCLIFLDQSSSAVTNAYSFCPACDWPAVLLHATWFLSGFGVCSPVLGISLGGGGREA